MNREEISVESGEVAPDQNREQEELRTVVRCGYDRVYEMANPEMFMIDARANPDPTVAEVIDRTRKVIEGEEAPTRMWGSRAEEKYEAEPKEKYMGLTAQGHLELSQKIRADAELLLGRLTAVPPERKMKEVLQGWQQA